MKGTTGKLIALEGIDGSGTTTQAARLADYYGERLHVTREPSDGPVGVEIRKILRGEHASFPPASVALLFAADRLDHLVREIWPALSKGVHVLSDRYLMSSLVYQSHTVERGWIAEINRRAPEPDLTILLDLPVEVAAERRRARGGPEELFDALDIQRAVAQRYRAETERLRDEGQPVAIVDATEAPEDVFRRVRAAVESCIQNPGGSSSTA